MERTHPISKEKLVEVSSWGNFVNPDINQENKNRFDFEGQGAQIFVKFLVSNAIAGALIGSEGRVIQALQSASGAKISLSPHGMYFPGTSERVVAVEGTERGIFKVIDWVTEHMDEDRMKLPTKVPVSLCFKICVPRSIVGSLIGKNGGRITQLRSSTGVLITISPLFVSASIACSERVFIVECRRKEKMRAALTTLFREINLDPDKNTCKHVIYSKKLDFKTPDDGSPIAQNIPTPSDPSQLVSDMLTNRINRSVSLDSSGSSTERSETSEQSSLEFRGFRASLVKRNLGIVTNDKFVLSRNNSESTTTTSCSPESQGCSRLGSIVEEKETTDDPQDEEAEIEALVKQKLTAYKLEKLKFLAHITDVKKIRRRDPEGEKRHLQQVKQNSEQQARLFSISSTELLVYSLLSVLLSIFLILYLQRL